MQRTIKYILYTFFATAFLVSCGKSVSLQSYYVDNQENKGFRTQDIPMSIIEIDQSNFTEAQRQAYNSVERLNALLYKVSDTDLETYNAELAKVKAILNHEKYNDLIEVSDRGRKIAVKYVGTDAEADEVVVFGSDKAMGFAIVRILGDGMNPEKMGVLINSLQNANVNENQIQDIMNFFK